MSLKPDVIRPTSSVVTRQMRSLLAGATVTLFALMILMAYLSPFGYMVATGLKTREMITEPNAPIWPAQEATLSFEGKEYPIYKVPAPDGKTYEWALFKPGREENLFLDPENLQAGPIQWTGKWRTLDRVWEFNPQWENFGQAWEELRMPVLLRNTFVIAVVGAIGTLLSCTAVAYGFSRFRIPGKGLLFMLLISSIILPSFVTIVPT